MRHRSSDRNTLHSSRGSMAEFAPALIILFLLIAMPLIDLVGVAAGYGELCYFALRNATVASTQTDYDASLAAIERESNQLNSSGFANFMRLRPRGGYHSTGTDLFVDALDWRGAQPPVKFGPNTPVPPPIDTSATIYEMQARETYEVGPLVSLASIPFLGAVPALGKPAQFTVNWNRTSEFPQGLSGVSAIATRSTGNSGFNGPSGTGPGGGGNNSTISDWNYPGLYERITAAGQTIVAESVLQVQADTPNWTSTNLNVQPGEKIWVDYRADGLWSNQGGVPLSQASPTNANGITGGAPDKWSPQNGFPKSAMLGKMTNGQAFLVGAQQWNMNPPGSGELSLIFNEICNSVDLNGTIHNPDQNGLNEWAGNPGVMTVRIVLAR